MGNRQPAFESRHSAPPSGSSAKFATTGRPSWGCGQSTNRFYIRTATPAEARFRKWLHCRHLEPIVNFRPVPSRGQPAVGGESSRDGESAAFLVRTQFSRRKFVTCPEHWRIGGRRGAVTTGLPDARGWNAGLPNPGMSACRGRRTEKSLSSGFRSRVCRCRGEVSRRVCAYQGLVGTADIRGPRNTKRTLFGNVPPWFSDVCCGVSCVQRPRERSCINTPALSAGLAVPGRPGSPGNSTFLPEESDHGQEIDQ